MPEGGIVAGPNNKSEQPKRTTKAERPKQKAPLFRKGLLDYPLICGTRLRLAATAFFVVAATAVAMALAVTATFVPGVLFVGTAAFLFEFFLGAVATAAAAFFLVRHDKLPFFCFCYAGLWA